MEHTKIDLSRISKILIDRDQVDPDMALTRRQSFGVTIAAGADVESSRELQLALLTAAELASRCFPNAVRVAADKRVLDAPVQTPLSDAKGLGEALTAIAGATVFSPPSGTHETVIVIGSAQEATGAIRLTFDGWCAMAGPCTQTPRLPERGYCSLAPLLAAALAVSEVFLRFAEVDVAAGRRTVGLSLWRPDIDPRAPEGVGIPVEYLPASAWILGLGHLGNAYLWALASLPYADSSEVTFFLNDFDKVEAANAETGILFKTEHDGRLKSRVVADWLAARSFQTRLIERRFDENFRVQESEPALSLCGFDNNNSRRDLPTAGFRFAVSTGLGGTATNFDAIGLNALPNARRPEDIWPADTALEEAFRAEQMASTNKGYVGVGRDRCGRARLAGKSVAVPFVGLTAACLAVSEVLRLLHDGPKYENLKLRLGRLSDRVGVAPGRYKITDAIGLMNVRARQA